MKKLRLASIASAVAFFAVSNTHAITLEQSYELALKNDITFARAASVLEGNRANANTAYAGILPQVGLTYNWTLSRNLSQAKDLQNYISQVRLTLSQNIFNWSTFLSLNAAEKSKRQAHITYVTAQQDLISRVISGYLSVLTAYDNLNVAKSGQNYYEQVFKSTNLNYRSGLASAADNDTASAQLSAAKATYISAKAALDTAISNFKIIVGDEADLSEFQTLATNDPKLSYPTDVNSIIENLSLKSLAMTRELAKINNRVAIAAYIPTLATTVSLGNSSTNTVQIGERGWGQAHRLDRLAVGLTLTVPIFLGGQVYNNAKYTKELYRQASYSYDLTYKTLNANFKNNLSTIKADEEIISSYANSYSAAQKALNARNAGYKSGVASLTDVLNAVNTLNDVELKLSTAKYNYINTVMQQKVLAGKLNENDLKIVSNLLTKKVNFTK